MNEITYILGAGASYYSFPVVKTFADRMNYFFKVIDGQSTMHHKEVANELHAFISEIRVHQSFDTYFKKLFHLGKDNDILRAKKVLNYYFLLEQLEFPSTAPIYFKYSDINGNDIDYPLNENSFNKKDLVDSRYDALIAGLLKPIKGEAKFFTKINFITWNYDLNLLASIKNFLAPDRKINEFISDCTINENENIWKIADDLQIINMNGYFFSDFFKDLKNFNTEDIIAIRNLLHEMKYFFALEKNILTEDAKKIKFGWEDIHSKNSLIENAVSSIKNSKSVVIIGYTFPSYNRYLDAKYFTGTTLAGKEVFIQDPNADEIVSFLNSEFDIEQPFTSKSINKKFLPKISAKKNCDSFYIPNNIISKI